MVTPLQRRYLQLAYGDFLTRGQACRLIKHCGSMAALATASRASLLDGGLTNAQQGKLHQILGNDYSEGNELTERTDRWLEQGSESRSLVCFEDAHYPDLLKEISCPPPILFVVGDPVLLDYPQLAIVGSRRSSCSGELTAAWLAAGLVARGFCVTSGMAAGIDSCAHSGALDAGGSSIAVLGTGIDRIYPSSNRHLAKRLSACGALVSEFPLDTPPISGNFPQRNRIIAGLGLGVIVVEAALKSGSLITARLAMENNREVFAVPGSIHSVNARGCNRLIRDGASLLEDIDSVIEELSGPLMGVLSSRQYRVSRKQVSNSGGSDNGPNEGLGATDAEACACLSKKEQDLLQLISFDPLPAEVLAAKAGISIEQARVALTRLEVNGIVRQSAGRYQRLATGFGLG